MGTMGRGASAGPTSRRQRTRLITSTLRAYASWMAATQPPLGLEPCCVIESPVQIIDGRSIMHQSGRFRGEGLQVFESIGHEPKNVQVGRKARDMLVSGRRAVSLSSAAERRLSRVRWERRGEGKQTKKWKPRTRSAQRIQPARLEPVGYISGYADT